MSGSISVTGGSNSNDSGQRLLPPFTISNSLDAAETILANFVIGDNVFSVPTNAVGVVIVPPQANATSTWLLRTSLNAGDTGLPLNSVQASVYVFPAAPLTAPTTITIHASAVVTEVTLWFW